MASPSKVSRLVALRIRATVLLHRLRRNGSEYQGDACGPRQPKGGLIMDWSNERYVRVYTRDTADYQILSWQARGLWLELLRKADRCGFVATSHGARGIAALVRWPLDVVDAAMTELVADGCLVGSESPVGFVIPNYLDAQETEQSGAQRTREYRARRRDRANDSVTNGHSDETKYHQNVTAGDNVKRDVTNGDSYPIRADPSDPIPLPDLVKSAVADAPKPGSKSARPTDTEQQAVRRVLDKLGDNSGVSYRGSPRHTKLIVDRLRSGITEFELRFVIGYCSRELRWAEEPADGRQDMRPFLRPETLFGPQTIERYLDAARTWAAKRPDLWPADAAPPPELAKPTLAVVPSPFDDPRWKEPSWMLGGKS